MSSPNYNARHADSNPYEPPAFTGPDAPAGPRLWQRALALAVPTVAGALIMCGVGALDGSNLIMAPVFFGLAACCLWLAWGWTR